jgi:phage recombination protein Bet
MDEPVAEATENDAPAEEEATPPSEEVAIVERKRSDVTTRARGAYDSGQMALIKATVAKDCSDGELAMFLELCARYQLDPFAKQIWAAKMGGSNGPVTIMVSRDGLLTLANRHSDFEGMDGDIVRANDSFRKLHGPEGLTVQHEVTNGSIKERGEIVGAWAVVYRTDRRPTYFFAPYEQYKKGDKSPWAKQTDAMILKVAESMALRKAFSISGVVGEDEMVPQRLTAPGGDGGASEVRWPEDEELTENLKKGFEVLGYAPAKVRLLVNGKSEDELRALLADLHREAEGEEVTGEIVGEAA